MKLQVSSAYGGSLTSGTYYIYYIRAYDTESQYIMPSFSLGTEEEY